MGKSIKNFLITSLPIDRFRRQNKVAKREELNLIFRTFLTENPSPHMYFELSNELKRSVESVERYALRICYNGSADFFTRSYAFLRPPHGAEPITYLTAYAKKYLTVQYTHPRIMASEEELIERTGIKGSIVKHFVRNLPSDAYKKYTDKDGIED